MLSVRKWLVSHMQGLRQLCTEHGALLCFDEVMTGFRIAKGCAQEHFGITPDLTTVSLLIPINPYPIWAPRGCLGRPTCSHGASRQIVYSSVVQDAYDAAKECYTPSSLLTCTL